jgi:hypothetical protein
MKKSTKFQAPTSKQALGINFQKAADCLFRIWRSELGACLVFGAWCLEF